MVFSTRNYHLLLLGIFLVVVGYAIMRLENEVDGFISLYIAPLLILGGYLEIIYAILWQPRRKEDVPAA
jgi:NADH:ubiquinone oxidoreductase subunit 4 (subunit M)